MKYLIKFTEEMWYRLEIEADSEEQANEKFWSGEWDDKDPDLYGGEIHPDTDIYLITDEKASA